MGDWSDGQCDYLCRQSVDYAGIPEAQQMGFAWANAVHPDDRAQLASRFKPAVAAGSRFDVELRLRSAAGDHRRASLASTNG